MFPFINKQGCPVGKINCTESGKSCIPVVRNRKVAEKKKKSRYVMAMYVKKKNWKVYVLDCEVLFVLFVKL